MGGPDGPAHPTTDQPPNQDEERQSSEDVMVTAEQTGKDAPSDSPDEGPPVPAPEKRVSQTVSGGRNPDGAGQRAEPGPAQQARRPPSVSDSQRQRRKTRVAGVDSGCSCRKSKCLKLYCECFAAKEFCVGSCRCESCCNTIEQEELVLSARWEVERKRPGAFTQVAGGRGCNCTNSGCQKGYCECFRAGVPCTEVCNCTNCHNKPADRAKAQKTAKGQQVFGHKVVGKQAGGDDSDVSEGAKVQSTGDQQDSARDTKRTRRTSKSAQSASKPLPISGEELEWVQCDRARCQKWRALPPHIKASCIDKFYCSMGKWNPPTAKCSAKEETVLEVSARMNAAAEEAAKKETKAAAKAKAAAERAKAKAKAAAEAAEAQARLQAKKAAKAEAKAKAAAKDREVAKKRALSSVQKKKAAPKAAAMKQAPSLASSGAVKQEREREEKQSEEWSLLLACAGATASSNPRQPGHSTGSAATAAAASATSGAAPKSSPSSGVMTTFATGSGGKATAAPGHSGGAPATGAPDISPGGLTAAFMSQPGKGGPLKRPRDAPQPGGAAAAASEDALLLMGGLASQQTAHLPRNGSTAAPAGAAAGVSPGAVMLGAMPACLPVRSPKSSPKSSPRSSPKTGGDGERSADGKYHCQYPGCNKVFNQAGALHTHTGWHKRNLNIKNGVYDRLGHRLKETHSVTDATGRVTQYDVYRCDYPGCGKHFQSRGALQTHQVRPSVLCPQPHRHEHLTQHTHVQGWHKRQPKEGQTTAFSSPPQFGGVSGATGGAAILTTTKGADIVVEVPRQRPRKRSRVDTGASSANATHSLAGTRIPPGWPSTIPPRLAPEDSEASLVLAMMLGSDADADDNDSGQPDSFVGSSVGSI